MQWDTSPLEGIKPDVSFAFSHQMIPQKRKESSKGPTRRPRSSPHSPRWPRCGGWWWPHRPAPAPTAHSGSPWLRSDPPWVWKHSRGAAIHNIPTLGSDGLGQSHPLGVKVVQQVVGVAVAVSAHHHQGNQGSQENGGQHPDGHNHHRLHGDSGPQSGWRLQLELRVQSGSSDCLSSSTNGRSAVEAESKRNDLWFESIYPSISASGKSPGTVTH